MAIACSAANMTAVSAGKQAAGFRGASKLSDGVCLSVVTGDTSLDLAFPTATVDPRPCSFSFLPWLTILAGAKTVARSTHLRVGTRQERPAAENMEENTSILRSKGCTEAPGNQQRPDPQRSHCVHHPRQKSTTKRQRESKQSVDVVVMPVLDVEEPTATVVGKEMAYVRLLDRGEVLIKHTRRGKPKQQWINCGKVTHWCDLLLWRLTGICCRVSCSGTIRSLWARLRTRRQGSFCRYRPLLRSFFVL